MEKLEWQERRIRINASPQCSLEEQSSPILKSIKFEYQTMYLNLIEFQLPRYVLFKVQSPSAYK